MNILKEFYDKKIKTNVKKICAVAVVTGIAIGSYKFGKTVAVLECDYCLSKFLNDHPDVKEPFVKAYQELCNCSNIVKNK